MDEISYTGVDLSEKCIEACKSRFQNEKHADFFVNDGVSLKEVSDVKYDLVFSFDSLVHVDDNVMKNYINQIIGLLQNNGVAFIHHSNLGMYVHNEVVNAHNRNLNVSANIIEKIVLEAGGHLLTQEILPWGESHIFNDCISLFCKEGDYSHINTRKLVSKNFMDQEVSWANNIVFKYHI